MATYPDMQLRTPTCSLRLRAMGFSVAKRRRGAVDWSTVGHSSEEIERMYITATLAFTSAYAKALRRRFNFCVESFSFV